MSPSQLSRNSSPLPFVAKTYKLNSLSTRGDIHKALADDPVLDHWKAMRNLNNIPDFHKHQRHTKTITNRHDEARIEVEKEHDTATTIRVEFVSYQRILQHYMKRKGRSHLEDLHSKFEALIQLLNVIVDRLEDLRSIEEMLYVDNPDLERLPKSFCKTLEVARDFDANAFGAMLHYHAYLQNHGLVNGPDGRLQDPPPLKVKKNLTQRIAKMPKTLIRKIADL